MEMVDGASLYRGYFSLTGVDPLGTDCKVCGNKVSGIDGSDLLAVLDKEVQGRPFSSIAIGLMQKELRDKYTGNGVMDDSDFPQIQKTGPHRFFNAEKDIQGIKIPAKFYEVDARLHFVIFYVCEDGPGDCLVELLEKWNHEEYNEGAWRRIPHAEDDYWGDDWMGMIGPRVPDVFVPGTDTSNMVIVELAQPKGECNHAIILGDLSSIRSTLGGRVGDDVIGKDFLNLEIKQWNRLLRWDMSEVDSVKLEWSVGRKGREDQ